MKATFSDPHFGGAKKQPRRSWVLNRRKFVTGAASTVTLLAGMSRIAGAVPKEVQEVNSSMTITEEDVINCPLCESNALPQIRPESAQFDLM